MSSMKHWNLKFIDEGNETLLEEEKCNICGKELFSLISRYNRICAFCDPLPSHTKKTQCILSSDDPNFNKGHGEQFYRAFEIALKRGDFKK